MSRSKKPKNWRFLISQSSVAQGLLAHWQEFRPKMCKELLAKDLLHKTAYQAAERTGNLLVNLQREGMQYDRAKEIAYAEWYLLPDEEDQPNLTFNPATLQPDSTVISA